MITKSKGIVHSGKAMALEAMRAHARSMAGVGANKKNLNSKTRKKYGWRIKRSLLRIKLK
jgi:hypothetical protein